MFLVTSPWSNLLLSFFRQVHQLYPQLPSLSGFSSKDKLPSGIYIPADHKLCKKRIWSINTRLVDAACHLGGFHMLSQLGRNYRTGKKDHTLDIWFSV